MVAQLFDDVTPPLQCALVLLALPVFRRLRLLDSAVRVQDICEALGVSRSASYALAAQVLEAAHHVHRLRGRPATIESPPPTSPSLWLARAVVRYLMDNPGCVVPGGRRTYTNGFRRFVVGLLRHPGPAATLTATQVAKLLTIPVRTLNDWLAEPMAAQDTAQSGQSAVDQGVPSESDDTVLADPLASQPHNANPAQPVSAEPDDTDTDQRAPTQPRPLPGVIEQILALWRRWRGGFGAFVTMLGQHRICATARDVRQILADCGQRVPKRRGRGHCCAEAGRGSIETFYPNAQLFADGKDVTVTVNRHRFSFCWQTVVDGRTSTPTGLAIRDSEDGQGLLQALQMSKQSTGALPDAITRDGKPCNYTPEVEAALQQGDIISVPATPNRGQSKAPVEGLFGLFSQSMPPIDIQASSVKHLARAILWYVVFAYCAGRAAAPRPSLGGRSPQQAFEQDKPTVEQRRQARQRLTEIRNRILDQQARERRRANPVCRAMLEQAFADFDLSDTAGTIIPTIARYGLDAVLEAIAIFHHKRTAGRLPEHNRERYLLGIARNVAERNEDLAVYRETLRLRLKAHDMLVQPLVQQATRLADTLALNDYIDACLERALDAQLHIDRQFWADTCFKAFRILPEDIRRERGPNLARRIACQYRLPRSDRDTLLAALITATTGRLAT
jgi:hypothetical protein